MHTNVIDSYRDTQSPIHRLNPALKVLLVVGFILSNALLPDAAWLAFAASWGLVLTAALVSRLRVGDLLKRSLVALPFALAAVTTLFSTPGKALAVGQLGSTTLVITAAGLARFVSIVVRAWLSIQGALLLVATTRFPDLLHALEHLHVPRLLVTVIGFLYRYLFVLTDEALRLMRARASRSARLPGRRSGGSLSWRGKIAGSMVGQLFLRSYERSERVYDAMLARGYSGTLLTLQAHGMSRLEWLWAFACVPVFILLQFLGRWHQR